ncbi:uncharacterized protein LOC102701694 isoform X2 [Oryza brachyantha]|uniref:uncharacterized protein LOC102701694 isoform X2 n=1 Tax=Oryza brachyantha TaxID=4533 RepID=UPI000776ABD3|nr:uncharacterized protein LOC102701694 isoform X2 [Oryza brachyantha]
MAVAMAAAAARLRLLGAASRLRLAAAAPGPFSDFNGSDFNGRGLGDGPSPTPRVSTNPRLRQSGVFHPCFHIFRPSQSSPQLKGFRYMSEKRDTNGIETTEKFGSLLVERMSGLLETSKSIADSLERIARSLENPPVNKDYIEALNLQKPPPEDQLKHDVDDLVKDHNMIAKTVAVFLGEVRRQFPEVVGLSWIDSCITVGSDPWIQNLSRLALEILRKVRQEHPEWIVGLYLGSLLFLMVALSFSAPAESYYICDCMWYMHHAF